MKFCPECGNKLVEGAKFCPECGYKIAIVDEVSPGDEVIAKESSETYIKKQLKDSKIPGVSVVPEIDEKTLLNAAKNIAMDNDPSLIIGVIDTALLSRGKTGAAFTGTEVFVRGSFESAVKISYEGISKAEHDIETSFTEKGKKIEVQVVTVEYSGGEIIRIDSKQLGDDFPFKFFARLLQNFDKYVDKVESKNQAVQLTDLSPEIIELYFKAVISFLKSDDGIISSEEYKELITLMTKVKVSKAIANNLRKYRLSTGSNDPFEILIDSLKAELNTSGISDTVILQALALDILSMNRQKLNQWKRFDYLVDALNVLDISDKQIDFMIRKLKSDEDIIEKRLDDNQVSELTNELAAVASGAGVSLGALAVTGAVIGNGIGLYSGLAALASATTATLLPLAAIAGTGFSVYKGVKYISGTSELEKSGIRISTLTAKIEQLRAANVYIIDDINWSINKISDFAAKMQESDQLNNELMDEMMEMIAQSQSVAESGSLVEKDQEATQHEYLIANLPKKLDIEKYDELLAKDVNRVINDQFIKAVYLPIDIGADGTPDDSADPVVQELDGLFINENSDLEALDKARQILENIGYFDTKSSAAAQGKVAAKKAKAGLKSFFSGE
ncbi:MAG: zinc-ribbon domain-containing protein [Enterococcaceae bacterium]|jgi:hypothetical protein|nr:zinc-ribbon domain-containing protein [Enterococcaceae bacterium]